jgi:molecular chaperone GrpE
MAANCRQPNSERQLTDKDASAGSADRAAPAAGTPPHDRPSATDAESAAAATADREQLELAQRQAAESQDKYLRAMAELDNVRKRSARELENARKFGNERLIAALLPVRDSLEASLAAAAGATLDAGAVIEGDRATLRILSQALADAGITEIDPEGEPFDPARHEAISLVPSQTAEPNSVINVVQKGYLLHERVLRPARVVVAAAPTEH